MGGKKGSANLIFITIGIAMLLISGILFMRVIYLKSAHESEAERQRKDIALQSREELPKTGEEAPMPNVAENSALQLNEATLTKLINDTIPADVPLKNMQIKITETGLCSFSVDANVKELATYAKEGDLGLIGAALKFMPEYVPLKGDFTLLTDGKGQLNIALKSMQFEGVDVPVSVVPKEIFQKLSHSVSEEIRGSGWEIGSLRFQPGLLLVERPQQ